MSKLGDVLANAVLYEPMKAPQPRIMVRRADTDEYLAAGYSGYEQCTDLGNARRLVKAHGADLRFCHEWKRWLIWDGIKWQIDGDGGVVRKAKDVVRTIYDEARDCADIDQKKRLAKWAVTSEGVKQIDAMIKLASTEPGIPIRAGNLDQNPWLLAVKNGVLDLQTGALTECRRGDYITKQAPVEFDSEREAPYWTAFLERIMDGDAELISFLKRGVGYSMTGSTEEQCLFIPYGEGANGKSTFIGTISEMLGDYSLQCPPETLMEKRGGGASNDVARLRGARFVSAVESKDGARLSENLVKQMTGSDTLSARFLYQEYFQFKPTHTVWLATNYKPVILGVDHAIWRRPKLVPFTVTIAEADQDKRLPERLRGELPGILNWAISGCLAWQREGLKAPDKVVAATAEYRNEMDVVGQWLEERCVQAAKASGRASELYEDYRRWSEACGNPAISNTAFGKRLTGRPGISKERTMIGALYRGVGLRA